MNILDHYDENNLHIHEPETFDNENYFCKLDYDKKPFIIQTNHICYNFKNILENNIYISIGSPEYALWIEQLYHKCIDIIYDKNKEWFDEPLEHQDIENSFLSPIKSNIKLNCYDVKCNIEENECVILDNNGKCIEKNDLFKSKIIPTIHIKGIQFNSKNFEFDMNVKYITSYGKYEENEEINEESNNKYTNESHEEVIEENNEIVNNNSLEENEITLNEEDNKDTNEEDNEDTNDLDNEDTNDLEEFEILPEDDKPIYLNNHKTFAMIYELATNKIDEDIREHITQFLTNKKIKINLDLEELFQTNDSDQE